MAGAGKMEFAEGEILEVLRRAGHEPKRKSGQHSHFFFCVFHADGHTPNMHVDSAKNAFHCFGCPEEGGVVALARQLGVEYRTADGRTHSPTDRGRGRPSNEQMWKEWAAALWTEDGAEALAVLRRRGFNDETMRAHSIGVSCRLFQNEVSGGWRITIPVFDENGNLLVIRRYHPQGKLRSHIKNLVAVDDPSKTSDVSGSASGDGGEAPCPACGAELRIAPSMAEAEIPCPRCGALLRVNAAITKIWSAGKSTIYGRQMLTQLRKEVAAEPGTRRRVVINGGEWDRLILLQYGIHAVTGTAGEGTWKAEWSAMFDGLDAVVMLDADEAGQKGASKIARSLQERSRVASLKVLKIPFRDEDRLANGQRPKDANDWFLIGRGADELLAAIDMSDPIALTFHPTSGPPSGTPGGGGSGAGGPQNPSPADAIDDVRELGKEVPAFRKHRMIWEIVRSHLAGRGRFMRTREKSYYYFDTGERRLHVVCNEELKHFLMDNFRVNPVQQEFKYSIAELEAEADRRGELVRVRRFCHWVRETNLLYMSQFDGNVARISDSGVDIVPNGTDGVVFLDSPEDFEPWTFATPPKDMPPEKAVEEVMRYVSDIHFDALRCPPEVAQKLLTLWIISVFFGAGIKTRPICTFIGEKGSGKCLSRDTPVLMHDGTIRPVQDIHEGELVMGPDSKPRLVGGITRGHGPLYRIVPTKGDPWICNEEHILTVVLAGRMNRKGEWIGHQEVIDVPLKECASAPYGTRVKRRGYAMLLRTGVDFARHDVPVDPYLAGLWLGDGSVIYPEITNVDDEILSYCREIAPRYGVHTRVKVDRRNGVSTVVFTTGNNRGQRATGRNPLLNFFRTMVVEGQKRIPESYLVNDEQTRLNLLAGLIDTDGHYASGYYDVVTKYPGLRDDILRLARSLGFAAYSRETKKSIKRTGFEGTYHRIGISGDIDRIPCRLPRKKAAPRRQIKNVLHTGFRIEPVGDGDYYGFTLDGDGRFLLGDFTVTHNTMALQRFLQICFGEDSDVTSVRQDNQDDMQAAVLSSPLVVFDNVDNDAEFLNDELAKIATGMKIVRRRLYSTLGTQSFKPDCFVGITTQAPHFTRSDVIDRMLLFRVSRRGAEGFGFGVVPTISAPDRARFFSAVAALSMRVLAAVRDGKRPSKSPYRLADWSTMAFAIGVALGWDAEEMEGLMSATEWMRIELQAEEDPLVDLITRWLNENDLRQGKEYRASELVTEWNDILKKEGSRISYHAKWVGRKIKDALPALSKRWKVTITRQEHEHIDLFKFDRAKDEDKQIDLTTYMEQARRAAVMHGDGGVVVEEPSEDHDDDDDKGGGGSSGEGSGSGGSGPINDFSGSEKLGENDDVPF